MYTTRKLCPIVGELASSPMEGIFYVEPYQRLWQSPLVQCPSDHHLTSCLLPIHGQKLFAVCENVVVFQVAHSLTLSDAIWDSDIVWETLNRFHFLL